MKKFILSIDGGGVRGIIPAVILSVIENKSGKPISSMFDLMAGTSTGGILIAGLSVKDETGKPKYSAANIVNFYKHDAQKIFKKSNWFVDKYRLLRGAKYDEKPLENALEKFFGDANLEHVITPLVITAHDIQNGLVTVFKSYSPVFGPIKIRDVLRATSAAPTYFSAKKMKIGQTNRLFIDGVVFAQNPADCAYIEGVVLFPGDDIYMLSIGTGYVKKSITDEDMGVLEWGYNIMRPVVSSISQDTNYHLKVLLKEKFLRIESQLDPGHIAMDDASKENLLYLEERALAEFETHRSRIESFIKANESRLIEKTS